MTAEIIPLPTRRRPSPRLLAAAKAALNVLENMSLDEFMEGRDEEVRAELMAAIEEEEARGGTP